MYVAHFKYFRAPRKIRRFFRDFSENFPRIFQKTKQSDINRPSLIFTKFGTGTLLTFFDSEYFFVFFRKILVSRKILGKFSESFRKILRRFSENSQKISTRISENFSGIFREFSEKFPGIFRESKIFLKKSKKYSESRKVRRIRVPNFVKIREGRFISDYFVFGKFWENSRNILGKLSEKSRKNLRKISEKSQKFFKKFLKNFPTCSKKLKICNFGKYSQLPNTFENSFENSFENTFFSEQFLRILLKSISI